MPCWSPSARVPAPRLGRGPARSASPARGRSACQLRRAQRCGAHGDSRPGPRGVRRCCRLPFGRVAGEVPATRSAHPRGDVDAGGGGLQRGAVLRLRRPLAVALAVGPVRPTPGPVTLRRPPPLAVRVPTFPRKRRRPVPPPPAGATARRWPSRGPALSPPPRRRLRVDNDPGGRQPSVHRFERWPAPAGGRRRLRQRPPVRPQERHLAAGVHPACLRCLWGESWPCRRARGARRFHLQPDADPLVRRGAAADRRARWTRSPWRACGSRHARTGCASTSRSGMRKRSVSLPFPAPEMCDDRLRQQAGPAAWAGGPVDQGEQPGG